MKSNIEQKIYSNLDQLMLFKSFAESLKLPLLYMANSAEIALKTGDSQIISNLLKANKKLTNLVNDYLFSIELQLKNGEGYLQTVSVANALHDSMHSLHQDAQLKGIDLELDLRGKFGPVLAHPQGLQLALTSIGQAMLEAQHTQSVKHRPVIKLAAYKTGHGIVAGVYCKDLYLNKPQFDRSLKLVGQAKQPFNNFTSYPTSNIFIADSIFKSMDTSLRTARFSKMTGLAATFQPSQQLELI